MREFEFVLHYEPGTDLLMDVFQEHSGLTARTSECTTTTDAMWRIDHLRGPAPAVTAAEEIFTDHDRCNECLDDHACDTYREYHVLDREATSLTVYTYRREIQDCHSVPYIVTDHVGEGAVFEASRSGDAYRWKVLYPEDQPISELYDAIESELRDGLTLDVSHLTEAGRWDPLSRAEAQLSPDAHDVLGTAAAAGYYERPRETTVSELSDELDVARSTLQYRLRNAEDTVISQFVEERR